MRIVCATVAILMCTGYQSHASSPVRELFKHGLKTVVGETGKTVIRRSATETGKSVVKKAVVHSTAVAAKRNAARAAAVLGDDVVRAGKQGAKLIDDFGKATAKLKPQNQRRLAMMAKEWNNSGRTADVVEILASASDADGMIERLWKHKAKLAAGVGATALLLHGDELITTTGNAVIKPAITGSIEHIAAPAVKQSSVFGLGLFVVAVLLTPMVVVTLWLRFRRVSDLVSLMRLVGSRLQSRMKG